MSDAELKESILLDVSGLLCPMPIVKTSRAMKDLAPGDVLKLVATDKGAVADVPAWTESTGNELLSWREEGDAFIFFIRKGKEA